jgi:hypothetical protein
LGGCPGGGYLLFDNESIMRMEAATIKTGGHAPYTITKRNIIGFWDRLLSAFTRMQCSTDFEIYYKKSFGKILIFKEENPIDF